MKYFHLIWAALFRRKTRTVLTLLSIVMAFLLLASLVAILTTFGIVLSLLFESIRFFQLVSPMELLFGTNWAPQSGAPVDDTFGGIPLFWGTVLIGAIIAMIVAIPIGMMTAVYLTQYAAPAVRRWVNQLRQERGGETPAVAKAITPEQRRIQELEACIRRLEREKERASSGLVQGR